MMKINTGANVAAGLFGLLVGTLTYIVTADILLTLSAFLFSLFLAVATRPFYLGIFEKKDAPPATISVLRERGFENGAPEARVFYALIITQDVAPDVTDAAQKAILEDIFETSAAALSEKHDFFRSRYGAVREREMPMKICSGSCTEKSGSIARCYRDWQKHVRVDNRMYPGKENVDLFFHDLRFEDLSGVTRNAVTAVQFYRW
jgi:hypothetical protein